MFFQVHADEIQELPEVLADRVYLLPDVLQKSRADSTNKKYSSAFIRFLIVPRHIRCRFIVYTVHNFCDCNLKILTLDPIKYK